MQLLAYHEIFTWYLRQEMDTSRSLVLLEKLKLCVYICKLHKLNFPLPPLHLPSLPSLLPSLPHFPLKLPIPPPCPPNQVYFCGICEGMLGQFSKDLMSHQRKTLQWMLWREGETPSGGILGGCLEPAGNGLYMWPNSAIMCTHTRS